MEKNLERLEKEANFHTPNMYAIRQLIRELKELAAEMREMADDIDDRADNLKGDK